MYRPIKEAKYGFLGGQKSHPDDVGKPAWLTV